MKRRIWLVAATALATLLIAQAIVLAQTRGRPQFGSPSGLPFTTTIVSLSEAQAQIDYRIPLPTVLPSESRIVGAYFLAPLPSVEYPDAEPRVRVFLTWQDRLRPIGLVFTSPQGEFYLFRSSITVGALPTTDLPVRPYGLDLAEGARSSIDGFEYVAKTGVADPLGRLPSPSLNAVTWEYRAPTPPGLVVYDMLWTLTGPFSEVELVAIARSVN